MTILAARSNVANHRLGDAFLSQLSALATASKASDAVLGKLISVAVETVHVLAKPTTNVPQSLDEYLRQQQSVLPQQREQAEALAANSSPESLERQLSLLLDELAAGLAAADLPNTVNSDFGPVRLADHLRAACIILVSLAYQEVGAATRTALAEAVRALGAVLAERHPGAAIEVRVPPLTAVQIGALADASVHTRGTPPNVVEMGPRVFLTIATGTANWDDAYAAGQLSVSGAHANDVSSMLPILDLTS